MNVELISSVAWNQVKIVKSSRNFFEVFIKSLCLPSIYSCSFVMRAIGILFTFAVISGSHASAVASDLAMLARSPDDHPAAKLPGIKSVDTPPKESASRKSLVVRGDSSAVQDQHPLSLWRVRVALAVVIIAIVAALGSLAVHTARAFGLLPEREETPASPKGETDPESLTRLLNMQSIRGYSAIFTGSGLLGRTTPGEDKPTIIIQ